MRFLLLVLALLVATSLAPHAQSSRSARGSGAAPAAPARAIVHAEPQARVPGVSESFDDISTLPGSGWSQQNLSSSPGDFSWTQGSPANFPAHSGTWTAYIAAHSENTSGTGTISNWLITPEVDLANGTTMSFYTRTVGAPAFPDRLEVRLSTNGASTDVGTTTAGVGYFGELLLTINPDLTTSGYPNTWTQYTVTVSGLAAPTTGRFALRYYVTDGGPGGINSDYIGVDDVVVQPPPPMGADDLADALAIPSTPYAATSSTDGATVEAGEATGSCTSNDSGPSIWWRYTPASDGTVTIDLAGSNYDTVLSLWTGAGHPLSEVACDDDGVGVQSRLENVPLDAGTTYYVRVSGWGGNSGSVALAVDFTAAAPEDALAGAVVIDTDSYTDTGSNVSASAEPHEAEASCGFDGNKSIWWRYTPATDGTATISLHGSDFDTLLSLWTGANHPLAEVACNDDNSDLTSALVDVPLTAGTTYYVRVTGFGGNSGGVAFAFDFTPTAPPFSFLQPAAGQAFRVGGWLKAIWDTDASPTPDTDATPTPTPANVVLSLRKGDESYQAIYTGPNLTPPDFGAARYRIPDGTPAGDDYQLRIEDATNPALFAESPRFAITDPGAAYLVTSPAAGDRAALGSTQTLTWTAPAGASGTTVTLTLYDRATHTPVVSASTSDDGTETITIPPFASTGRYYLTLADDGNAAYTGTSSRFSVVAVDVVTPGGGSVYGAGSTVPITWEAPTTDPGATVRLLLKSPSQPTTVVAAATANDGSFDFVVPADLAPAPDYVVVVQIDLGGMPSKGRSEPFGIATSVTPAVAHFAPSAMWGTASSTLAVAAPGLADGSEIGAFMGGRLVGAGVVAGGVADVLVHGSILVPALVVGDVPSADDFVYVADGTALTLRAFASGAERALETTTAVSFVDGAETAVTLQGGTAQSAAAASLTVAAFPNPASTSATVRFSVGAAGAATVSVYDLLGRRVATAFEGEAAAGTHEVSMSVSSLPAGVYIARVTTPGAMQTVRLTVAR